MSEIRIDKKKRVNHGGRRMYVGYGRMGSTGPKMNFFSVEELTLGKTYSLSDKYKIINGAKHYEVIIKPDTRRVKLKKF